MKKKGFIQIRWCEMIAAKIGKLLWLEINEYICSDSRRDRGILRHEEVRRRFIK